MSVDGLFLHQIHRQMMDVMPCKIQKIYLASDTEVLLHCRGNRQNFKWLISVHPQFARMNITSRTYPTPEIPGNFTMLLRKHLEGGIVTSFQQAGLDRIFQVTIRTHSEIGDDIHRFLYIELMGKYANIILCDESHKILDALKRIPPYENTKRILQPGAIYTAVEAHDKKDPRVITEVDSSIPIGKQFHGFSPLLAQEAEYRMSQGQSFADIMQEILTSSIMYMYQKTDEILYHILPMTHLHLPMSSYPIMEGFDVLFFHKEERDRIRQQTGDLFKFVRRELHKNENKLIKLKQTMSEAYDCEKWRIYGELLYAYSHLAEKGASSITLPAFDGSGDVIIALDKKFDSKHNAKKCYQKYNKAKNAQIMVQEQIDKTEVEIAYFSLLQIQMEQAVFQDAKEIRHELASKGYMKQLQSKVRKKKETVPAYLSFTHQDAHIYVGKNNLQNDYVTWKLARKTDYWLHTKDLHGAHVVVQSAQLDEELLRIAANLAAFYSQGRLSSSVPVNYCQVKDIKKIPGSKTGMVALSAYKTIFIDPNEEAIKALTHQE